MSLVIVLWIFVTLLGVIGLIGLKWQGGLRELYSKTRQYGISHFLYSLGQVVWYAVLWSLAASGVYVLIHNFGAVSGVLLALLAILAVLSVGF